MTRRGFLTKFVLLIVLTVGAVVALSLVPLSPLKHSVELRLSNTLGRNVTIDSVRVNLLGRPKLILSGMTAQEDPAFGDGVFLRASEVQAGLDLVQLLRSRQIVIDSIEFKSAQLDLIRNRDGVWSWTTLGKSSAQLATSSKVIFDRLFYLAIQAPSPPGNVSASTLRTVKFDNASVRLKDFSEGQHSEVLYKDLVLNASITPQAGSDSNRTSLARGSLEMRSEEDGEADRFKGSLPFDIQIVDRGPSMISVSGSIGPGPIETKNIRIAALAINGEIQSTKNAPLTGTGQLSATDLEIHTANLSERVARALKLDQIGDMNPGTVVAGLETNFQILQGTVHTTGLRIQQLDGLGDANAPNGSFKIDSALILNYVATVVLTPEATSRVKSLSTALGLVVTILETNNRVSVPINVSGDVRNPEVQVDVSRIF